MIRHLLLSLLLSLCMSAFASPQVRVLALFPGKAMLEIDGQHKVLAAGERHASGVRLIEANPREARIEIDGVEQSLGLGSSVAASYAAPTQSEIRLLADGRSFYTNGLINGQPVRMLVDTGATSVAMSEREARRLGIPYVAEGTRSGVRTAAGDSLAYEVRLDSLKLGTRTFHRVHCLVLLGNSPENVLLGMNVLQEFEIEQQRNLMILRSRH